MYTRWLLAIIILGLSGGAAYWAGLAARNGRQSSSMEVIHGLAVASTDLDLGELWEEKGIVWQLPIRNQTAHEIEIHDFVLTCGCTEIKPRRRSIAVGDTTTIDMTLDLTRRSYSELGRARRLFEVGIYPVIDPKVDPQLGWRLHGIIRSRVTVDTPSLEFGEELVRGQPSLTRKVMATIHVANATLSTRVVPDLATVQINPSKESTSRFELIVAPRPKLPAGPFTCKLHIDLLTNDGDYSPGAIIPIAGKIQHEVRALPSRLVFGPQPVGRSAEATVVLQAPLGENWTIDHIEIETADVSVERVSHLDRSLNETFRVRQRIIKPGHQSSTIRFFVRQGQNNPVPLTMEVSYDGDVDGILSQTDEKGAK